MLNISPINFTKITNNFARANQPINQGLTRDVFVKSTNNVSFKGNEIKADKSDFQKWAEETDFVQTQLLDIITNKENEIGSGFIHTAFSIPGNDDYILRISTRSLEWTLCEENIGIAELNVVDGNDDINVGQEVATITIPDKDARPEEYSWKNTKIEVLRRQHGESIGVQPPETLVEGEWSTHTKPGVEPYEAPSRKEKYARTIRKVAELPVESYEKLIETFKKASETGYDFDYLNSNNLLVDTEEGAINLIDMEKGHDPVKPNYLNLLYALTNVAYYGTYTADWCKDPIPEDKREGAKQDTVTIINKFMSAMKNKGEKLNRNDVSFQAQIYLLNSLPMTYACGGDSGFWQKANEMGILEQ
ncbi:MAG: hypothetical protein IKU37_05345 [Candidatus Gastranaerophilales bacterium]|nr:hypothetical protein [Candidatus Gastranaerophilales bacterium]